jgi:hypothetical protein
VIQKNLLPHPTSLSLLSCMHQFFLTDALRFECTKTKSSARSGVKAFLLTLWIL